MVTDWFDIVFFFLVGIIKLCTHQNMKPFFSGVFIVSRNFNKLINVFVEGNNIISRTIFNENDFPTDWLTEQYIMSIDLILLKTRFNWADIVAFLDFKNVYFFLSFYRNRKLYMAYTHSILFALSIFCIFGEKKKRNHESTNCVMNLFVLWSILPDM